MLCCGAQPKTIKPPPGNPSSGPGSPESPDAWRAALRVVNHELNNSLTPVLTLARVAPRLIGQPGTQPKLEKIFATIADRAEHLRLFLAGYAQLARPPSPRLQATRWSSMLAQLAQLVPFSYRVEQPELMSLIDPSQMEQVLINLVKNATEAGCPPERIVVRVSRGAQAVEVVVRDHGPGMDAPVLARVMSPFFSTKPGGSGLGLALSRSLIRGHGGELVMYNHPEGGLEVKIRLPNSDAV